MKQITVKICYGTTCFVMGGSNQEKLANTISKKYGDKVEVLAITCLDLCKNNEYTKSPYVMVEDEVVSEATTEKVIDAIERKINEQ